MRPVLNSAHRSGARPPRRLAAAAAALAMTAGGMGLVAALAVPAGAATTNLLANPGFESGNLTGWSCDAGTGSVVGSPVHSGSYALAGAATNSDDAQCTQTVSVLANTSYTLSGYVEGAYVYIGITGGTSNWTPSATSWQQLSTTFTTGASQTSVQVYVHGWYAQGTYYADDLALTGPAGTGGSPSPSPSATSASPSPSPSSSPSASPSPSASVTSTGGTGSFTHPVYFMPVDNSPAAMSSIISGSGETQYNLAFVLDSGGCTPAWDGNSSMPVSSDTAVAADINTIRAAGGDVAVSFGGYNGTELGSTCGSASALAGAYQQMITKYRLTRVDFDYENTALDSNTAVRFGAIKIIESDNPGLKVSLTIPMTTVGFPGTGTDEIKQAIANGARLDIVNIMDFDTGLTSGTEVAQTEAVANDAAGQLESIYGWSAATAWSHMGFQIMNGHTDQPSELFTQSDFSTLLGFVKANHPAWFSFWSVNRDYQCPAGAVEPWAPGTCSNITQNPYDFTKIIVQYTG
ncbi:MAG TPA: carbohydrate binding domain-containing protein [Actinocrinis sp.]|uniref:carbohydrate binding domain-containing protein n=1 Tax=Actinocrinis sp. TaxID=1920516 RepID=UPI002DDCF748|nr:carbohydrate binding domain-containing protein [Actinocrinis sp.]HEV2344187.1 carbohydrate binding domain-containing protein [Actinocrinis sp.]